MPTPAPSMSLRRFWRLRFLARCRCGREAELRVHEVVTKRALDPDMTWQQLGQCLRCGGCGAASPSIDLPGWSPDQVSFADAYFPPN